MALLSQQGVVFKASARIDQEPFEIVVPYCCTTALSVADTQKDFKDWVFNHFFPDWAACMGQKFKTYGWSVEPMVKGKCIPGYQAGLSFTGGVADESYNASDSVLFVGYTQAALPPLQKRVPCRNFIGPPPETWVTDGILDPMHIAGEYNTFIQTFQGFTGTVTGKVYQKVTHANKVSGSALFQVNSYYVRQTLFNIRARARPVI